MIAHIPSIDQGATNTKGLLKAHRSQIENLTAKMLQDKGGVPCLEPCNG